MPLIKAIVVDCPDRCGEEFTVPVEVVEALPATLGCSTVTFRLRPGLFETGKYMDHLLGHSRLPNEVDR